MQKLFGRHTRLRDVKNVSRNRTGYLLHIDNAVQTDNNNATLVSGNLEQKIIGCDEAVWGLNTGNLDSTVRHECKQDKSDTLLSTARVQVREWHSCRALLDSSSQPNFVSRKLRN